MKLRTILLALLLVFGVALGGASHAHADYTLWTPTDNNQNVFSFNLTPQVCTMDAALYIYAPGAAQGTSNPGNALLFAISANQTYSATDFTIQETAGTWYVYNVNNAQILTLGSTNQFGLYYYYSSGYSSPILQPLVTDVSGLYDQWLLNNGVDNCDPILLVDATPQDVGSVTPIPPSVLLMASGLTGVLGFLRRFSG
jgi:hypothetical protein